MKSLSEKIIIVTGAAGGFGQQFTKQFLEQGAHLILTDINKETLEKVSNEIVQSIPQCKGKIIGIFASDLSTKKGCEEAYTNVIFLAPKVDILINNAGLITYGFFHETPIEKWETLMNVNVMALMYLSHHFMNHFVKQGSGHILNISSVSGFVGTASGASYSTSKFAVRGFGMSLYGEAKKYGINVTNVYPFYSPTPLLKTASEGNYNVKKTPNFLYSAPEDIVCASIKGLRKNKLHVYPGVISKVIYFLTKFAPITGNLAK